MIDFHCPFCDKLLRTAEAKAGLQAKCHGCGESVVVPTLEELTVEQDLAASQTSVDLPRPGEMADLYAVCPYCGAHVDVDADGCVNCGLDIDQQTRAKRRLARFPGTNSILREMRPFPPGEVISEATRIYLDRFRQVFGTSLVLALFTGLTIWIAAAPLTLVRVFETQNNEPNAMVAMIVGCALTPTVIAITSFLQSGYLIFLLNIVRGQPARLNDLFSGRRFLIRMAICSFLYYLLIVLGLLFLIIPGFLMAVMFLPYGHVLVDEDPPGFGCFRRAKQLTDGNWGSLCYVMILGGICFFFGCACYVGLFFSIPYLCILNTVAYDRMTRQTPLHQIPKE